MKLAGFLAGAGMAAIAVWGFNTWRHVSDMDRVISIIGEHCLPYVQSGTTPFEGLGRPVGVYDQAELTERITDGGNAILYENRFVAQWGESIDLNSPIRICSVKDSYSQADSVGFQVDTSVVAAWVDKNVIEGTGLVATYSELGVAPNLLIWEPPAEAERFSGLRIIITATETSMSSIMLVEDLVD